MSAPLWVHRWKARDLAEHERKLLLDDVAALRRSIDLFPGEGLFARMLESTLERLDELDQEDAL
jgi:hypothetical protein